MFAFLALALAPQAPPSDWVIPAGKTVTYDTARGVVHLNSLTVEPGGLLRALGPDPLVVVARTSIQIDGHLDASGFDAKPVFSLLTPYLPERGAAGACGGARGGTGSPLTGRSSPQGGAGHADHLGVLVNRGGRGGETGYGASPPSDHERGAGGGGGAFGPDEPGGGPGLVAQPGSDGHPLGTGAVTGTSPPRGGATNPRPFHDGDPTNDFWGRKLDATTGSVTVGELPAPAAGVGGGAGGDSLKGGAFPTSPLLWPLLDRKGAGGGGGGGLVVLLASEIRVGATGSVSANGGFGARGESMIGEFFIAGSSGGGSGGMLILEADLVDLGQAGAGALSAVGGRGGLGDETTDWSNGGDGGPGLIQVHVADAATQLVLPAGSALADVSAPNGHVLLPEH